jgi:hypothetical protein
MTSRFRIGWSAVALAGSLLLIVPARSAVRILRPQSGAILTAREGVTVVAELTRDGQPVRGAKGRYVTARITGPGGMLLIPLHDDGRQGDAHAGNGIWSGRARYTPETLPPGPYRVQVKCALPEGETLSAAAPFELKGPGPDYPRLALVLGFFVLGGLIGAALTRIRPGQRKPAFPQTGEAAWAPLYQAVDDSLLGAVNHAYHEYLATAEKRARMAEALNQLKRYCDLLEDSPENTRAIRRRIHRIYENEVESTAEEKGGESKGE